MKSLVRAHPQIALEVVRIGNEQTPVIVIDNLLSNVNELVEDAVTGPPFLPFNKYYPGVRSPSPATYPLALYQILRDPIRDVFGFFEKDVVQTQSDFRMVTTRPEDLLIRQRVPHYDWTNPNIVVVLHYLSKKPFGGTSMYRHRKTGFERITAERGGQFEEMVSAELVSYRPEGYITEDNPLFEKIASFPASYNRAIIYSSVSLHSGDITPETNCDEDPRSGRLTGSTFFTFGLPHRPLPTLSYR